MLFKKRSGSSWFLAPRRVHLMAPAVAPAAARSLWEYVSSFVSRSAAWIPEESRVEACWRPWRMSAGWAAAAAAVGKEEEEEEAPGAAMAAPAPSASAAAPCRPLSPSARASLNPAMFAPSWSTSRETACRNSLAPLPRPLARFPSSFFISFRGSVISFFTPAPTLAMLLKGRIPTTNFPAWYLAMCSSHSPPTCEKQAPRPTASCTATALISSSTPWSGTRLSKSINTGRLLGTWRWEKTRRCGV
mmetsp:Transcript_6656/g.16233  ORF Transcript_6656/g.16233 Transcript_6656/m.16233 type:complete len:246 (-) Transcript_6656:74-811(-)